MNRTTSIDLGSDLTAFVEAQVERGRYNTKSDVIRAGVRLLEEQEVKLMALRASLIKGEQSGTSTRSVSDIWAAVKKEHLGSTG